MKMIWLFGKSFDHIHELLRNVYFRHGGLPTLELVRLNLQAVRKFDLFVSKTWYCPWFWHNEF